MDFRGVSSDVLLAGSHEGTVVLETLEAGVLL